MPLPRLDTARDLARFLLGWAGAFPLLLLITIPIGPWIAAAHYYTLPVLFFAHFLFAVAGFAFLGLRPRLGRWCAVAATVLAIASGVVALFVIPMIDAKTGGGIGTWAVRGGLYLLHGAYLAGNAWLIAAVFRFKAATTRSAPG